MHLIRSCGAGRQSLPLLLAGACLAALAYSPAAQAQTGGDPAADDQARLEEITVTAQKRSQNLQQVPVAISAITSDGLATQGVATTTELSVVVPGLNITQQLASIAPIIRGVGNYNAAPGAEGAVATYVDGVYQPDAYGAILSLSNIERIEVLRGPQGTLFGRNATGGLIHIITRTPSHETRGEVSVGYGNKQTLEASGYITGGLTESVAADLAIFVRDQGEGFGKNLTTGNKALYRDEFALKSKLVLDASDALTITLSGDYGKSTSDLGVTRRPDYGTVTLLGTTPPDNFFEFRRAKDNKSVTEQWGGFIRADLELGAVDILGLASYRESRTHLSIDQGESQTVFLPIDLPLATDTFTGELQIKSSDKGAIEWIAGVYFMDSRAGVYPFGLSGPGFTAQTAAAPGGPYRASDRTNEQNTKSYSVFGELKFNLGASTRLTAGARLTKDERDFTSLTVNYPVAGGVISTPLRTLTASYTEPTWRAVIDQDVGDLGMVYASYSRGFKSGIFNVFAPAGDPVEPEKLDAYEVGFKTEIGGALRFNGSAFYYKYKNLQLTTQVAGAAVLRNAAAAESKGFELEANWAVSSELTLDANVAFVDAKFEDFPNAELTTSNPTLAPCPGGAPGRPNCVRIGSATGNQLPRAPKWTFAIGGKYERPVSFGKIGLAANLYYNDGFYNDFANRFAQDNYTLVNANVFADFGPSENYRVSLWAKNLLNTKYYSFGTSTALGDFVAPSFGRQFGIRLSAKF